MKKGTVITLIVAVIAVGVWWLLKHFTDLTSKDYKYYGYYEDVKGLQASSGVFDKGVKVGKVSSVDLEGRQVKVTFTIRKQERLPVGTIAIIAPGDLLGGKSIRLELGKGPGFLPPDAWLKTGADTTFAENFDAKITPVIEEGKFMLRTVDTGLSDFNLLLIGGWGRRTQLDMQKLYNTSYSLTRTAVSANSKTAAISRGISSLDSMTKDPAAKNAKINKSLASATDKTDDFVKKDIGKQLGEISVSLNKFSANIEKISKDTKGAGKLLNDKKAYEGANSSLDTMNRSMTELQKNPPGLSIFGGKKKKKK